ncbi:MAG: response regulator transcription factor [Candidatus Rokuibacteriota bacterium]
MTAVEPIVFLVDDDPSVRRGLDRLLRAAGHRVETFTSAKEFLERSEHDGPQCVVLDVRMLGQGGIELHEHLVASGRDIPVIFITGHADVPTAVRAMKAGAVDFLSKPVDDVELLGATGLALERDRRRWEAERSLRDGGA